MSLPSERNSDGQAVSPAYRIFLRVLRSPHRGGIVNPFGAYDKPGGGGTDVVERITGDQGKNLVFGGTQHGDIVGPHDGGGDDAVTELTEQGGEGNHVVVADVSQWPEKRVAVSGNADVSLLSRKRRTAVSVTISNHRARTHARWRGRGRWATATPMPIKPGSRPLNPRRKYGHPPGGA